MTIDVDKRLRVLMVGPGLSSRGGMATVERQLVSALPSTGIEVDFLSTYEEGAIVQRMLAGLRGYIRFSRILDKYDIVHIHTASRNSLRRKSRFANLAMSRGRKVIFHLHGGEFAVWFDNELAEKDRSEVRSLFDAADAVVVLSEEWAEWMTSRRFSPKRLVVMHNAVSVPMESCSPRSHRDILFLGRLDENKGPDVLLRASVRVLKSHPETKLVFGGDGSLEKYKALANKLGISDRCEFLGWVAAEEKELLFERAAVYCLPSKNEGMPMSLLEAMARGIPAIATPVGGVRQVIEDGIDGFLVPVGDEIALSECISHLLGSKELRSSVGRAGREKIEGKFSIECNVAYLEKLYANLMGQN